jgi:hypothetical protein
MKAAEILVEFYDPNDDELGKAHMDDSRRPRLTLSHLQKLRKSRDMEKYEKAQHLDFIPDMYGQTGEPDIGM